MRNEWGWGDWYKYRVMEWQMNRRTANVATNVWGRKGPLIEKVNLLYVWWLEWSLLPSVPWTALSPWVKVVDFVARRACCSRNACGRCFDVLRRRSWSPCPDLGIFLSLLWLHLGCGYAVDSRGLSPVRVPDASWLLMAHPLTEPPKQYNIDMIWRLDWKLRFSRPMQLTH